MTIHNVNCYHTAAMSARFAAAFLMLGVALIAGSYFNLHGWGLLLVTTPAAIITLVAALMILAAEKQRDAGHDPNAASDFYAG